MAHFGLDDMPVFHPTEEEFQDFSAYITKIEKQVPNVAICKVVPPKGWRPRNGNYDDVAHFVIPNPIEQVHCPLVRELTPG